MRTLRFIVDGESIKQDPACDFSSLFPGKNPDVLAEFVFSSEWENTIKVAAFWSMLDKEYEPQVIEDDTSCVIPSEALASTSFKIQIFGKNGKARRNARTLSTNKLTIRQTGGRR